MSVDVAKILTGAELRIRQRGLRAVAEPLSNDGMVTWFEAVSDAAGELYPLPQTADAPTNAQIIDAVDAELSGRLRIPVSEVWSWMNAHSEEEIRAVLRGS